MEAEDQMLSLKVSQAHMPRLIQFTNDEQPPAFLSSSKALTMPPILVVRTCKSADLQALTTDCLWISFNISFEGSSSGVALKVTAIPQNSFLS